MDAGLTSTAELWRWTARKESAGFVLPVGKAVRTAAGVTAVRDGA